MAASAAADFDRATAAKEFDDSRAGVRGLVESGATVVPPLFRHGTDPLPSGHPPPSPLSIPTVDLSLPRPLLVDLVAAASRDWGFFQVTNHGIPLPLIDSTIAAVRSFHDLPAAARSPFYSRGLVGGVSYASNVDLYHSAAASWRDTIQIAMGPARPDPARIPPECRAEVLEWDERVRGVARVLMGLMCEGLGISAGRLEALACLEGRLMVCHYYPPCPEPERTMGTVAHTDPSVLTVLVQDGVGGLQVRRDGEDGESCWVGVEPVPGALVINVGDLLQMISNDGYKSVEHRAVIKSREQARVSIAIFFNPGKRGDSDLYGPLPELVSPENPPHYRDFTMKEFMGAFFSNQLSNKLLIDHFKL